MARGNQIVIQENPRGQFLGGIIVGTPLPGTIVQMVAGTAVDGNGHFRYEVYDRDADGNHPQGPLIILLENGEGNDFTVAYETLHHANLYIPLPGDDLNVRWSTAGTGTGDSLTVGQIGIVDDGTGLIVDTTGSPESEAFTSMEALTDTVATGTLAWARFSGY